MIVSGMPERNGDRHVSEIASMALDLLAGLKKHFHEKKNEISLGMSTFAISLQAQSSSKSLTDLMQS